MKELQQVVSEKMATMIEDGSIEKMIVKNIENTISDVMRDVFTRYSNIGKTLEEKISASMGSALKGITLPEYNKFVADTVLTCYGNVLEQQSAEQLKKLLSESLAPMPKTITAELFLDEIAQYWEDLAAQNHGEIKLGWERGDSYINIKINHPEFDFNSIKVSLYNHCEDSENHYHIGYITGEHDRVLSGPVINSTYAISGLEGFLYRLYCAQTIITDFDDFIDENIYVEESY